MTVHKVAPPAAAGWNEIDARTQFATGKAAMAFGGSWQQAAIKKDNPDIEKVWGTFPIPGPDGKAAPAFAGGSDIAPLEGQREAGPRLGLPDRAAEQAERRRSSPSSLGFFPVYSDLSAATSTPTTR